MRKVSSWRGQGVSPRAWLRAGRGSWLSFDRVQIKGSSRTSRDSHSPRSLQIDNLEVILELIPGGAESKPMHAFLVGFRAFPKLVTLMAFGESSFFSPRHRSYQTTIWTLVASVGCRLWLGGPIPTRAISLSEVRIKQTWSYTLAAQFWGLNRIYF
jgi:hypothetical protein